MKNEVMSSKAVIWSNKWGTPATLVTLDNLKQIAGPHGVSFKCLP